MHPAMGYSRPLVEQGLGLGVMRSLVLGTYPQLSLSYHYHLLDLDSQSKVQGMSLLVQVTKEY